MNIRNCSRCGKIYIYDGFNICLDCRRKDEEDFQKVKKYLEENPGANVMEVTEETGVDSRKVIEFLKEGRLEIKEDNNLLLQCERCGRPIRTGRFCEKCTVEMEREFKHAIGGGKDLNSLQDSRVKERIRITDRYREHK